ncbi:MAG TPA: prolipoprotein diacylglyceryl transferase [Gemmatimonadaceae bacterium]
MMVIPYPRISPVIIQVGPFALRWYGVMYVVGYVLGFRLALARILRGVSALTRQQLDSLLGYLVVGMLLGARLVYVLVYDPAEYRAHPVEVFALWRGGLSFHGAILGMAAACALAARRFHLSLLEITDTIALCGAPGLFFGRLGNFINGELYGRPSNVPWAMVFPTDALHVPRHPSQAYEALAEGVLLSLLLWVLDRRAGARGWKRPGLLTATFLIGYGVIRFLLEFTRQPDVQLGFVLGPFSMGQLLSATMFVVGVALLGRWASSQHEASSMLGSNTGSSAGESAETMNT